MSIFSLKRYCPECQCRDFRRSRRRGIIEKVVLPFLLLRPFRCKKCHSRFVGLCFAASVKEDEPDKPIQGNMVDF